jgi:hypothetical protein
MNGETVLYAKTEGSKDVYGIFKFDTEMRISPTVSVTGQLRYWNANTSKPVPTVSVTKSSANYSNKQSVLRISFESNTYYNDNVIDICAYNTAVLAFDCEIY